MKTFDEPFPRDLLMDGHSHLSTQLSLTKVLMVCLLYICFMPGLLFLTFKMLSRQVT